MLNNLNIYYRRYLYMIMYMITSIILVSSICIFKYTNYADQRYVEALIQSTELIAIMNYNSNLAYSLIAYMIMGLLSIGGTSNSDAMIILFFSLSGYLIYLIRLIHKRNIGEIQLENTVSDRLSKLFNNDIGVIDIDILYETILFILSISMILNAKNSFITKNPIMNDNQAMLLALVTYIPVFNLVLIACNARVAVYVRYIKSILFGIYYLSSFIQNQTTEIWLYQTVIEIIAMITTVYSIWYGNRQRSEGRYIERY